MFGRGLICGDSEGGAGRIADGLAALAFQLLGEIRPETCAFKAKIEQARMNALFAGRFEGRGDHAGGGPAGAASGRVRIKQGDGCAAPGKFQRAAQPDDACACNGNAGM